MLNKLKCVKGIVKTAYLIILTVYLIIREIMPLQFLIDKTIVSVAFFLIGFLLIFIDFISEKNCLRGKVSDFFVAFIAISIISSIVNYKYGIASNIKCIAAMVLEYFLFFSWGTESDKRKNLKIILNTVITTLCFFVLVSIGMYLFSIDYEVIANIGTGAQGFNKEYGRLWGVFGDPNVIAYISIVSVFASVYFMFVYKKVWAYIIYGLNIFFQMSFIVLSLSRSGVLILLTVPIIASLYIFLSFIKTDKRRAVGGVLLFLCVSLGLFGAYFGLLWTIPGIKKAINMPISAEGREAIVNIYDDIYRLGNIEILNLKENHNISDEEFEKEEIEKIKRKDQKDDYSNGRFERWKAGLTVFKTTPVLGTSPRNAVAIAKEKTPNTVMGKYGWVTHCSYLEILVNTGIIGALVMLTALIYIAVTFIKSTLKKGFNADIFISFICFVTVSIGAFFVSDVFFVFSVSSLLFFVLLGNLYSVSEIDNNSLIYKICCKCSGGAEK